MTPASRRIAALSITERYTCDAAPASAADTDGAVTTLRDDAHADVTLPSLQPLWGLPVTVGRVLAGNLHLVGFHCAHRGCSGCCGLRSTARPSAVIPLVVGVSRAGRVHQTVGLLPTVRDGWSARKSAHLWRGGPLWWLWSRSGLYNHAFR